MPATVKSKDRVSLTEVLSGLGTDFQTLTDDGLRSLLAQTVTAQHTDRKENQLLYYKPVSPVACAVHDSQARFMGVGGGNGASKTDTILAELIMHATGVYPEGLPKETREHLLSKFRGPVAVRVVVESLTTTLDNVILPKLQWWKWSGVDSPGGDKGHWGWVPRSYLATGTWQGSYAVKNRTLRVLCKDPDTGELLGESTFQFMAHNQDSSDFASGDFHHILHDELTTYPIWRENTARTMRVGGRMYLAMTWPDDPSIAVDWAYDELYEPGRPGPDKDVGIDWFEMWTSDNPNLRQEVIADQATRWSAEVAAVRLQGKPIRFSNRVHPLFTDQPRTICTDCGKENAWSAICERKCDGGRITEYCHVEDFTAEPSLPTVFLLDPHPRKPHMGMWVQCDSWDDLWVVAEVVCEGGPDELKAAVDDIELSFQVAPVVRIGDPNMLRSPASSKRGVTWQDEFADVGLAIDLADNSDVGRARVNEYLRVDPDRRAPRLHIHKRCALTIRQFQRYVWDEYKHALDRDMKQVPKMKDDDMPTLLKYLMNFEPKYDTLRGGGTIIKTRGRK